MITIMDYPEYKKKYPKKSMSEWFAYQVSGSEQFRAEEIIQEYEQEFLK